MPDFCTIVAEILAQRTSAEWLDLLDKAEIPCARLNSTADLYSDPHLADVGFFQTLDDPRDGKLRMPRPPVRFSAKPAGYSRAAPMLGEHTEEVLPDIRLGATDPDDLEAGGAAPRRNDNNKK